MKTMFWFAQFGAPGLVAFLFVCAPAAEAHPPATQSQDSVAYQINQHHTGNINFAGGFSGSLTQLWSINLNGNVSYPLTANGTAFVTVGVEGGTLLDAVNLSTGATVWEKLLPGSSSWADAVYDGGKIFVADGSGELLAFKSSGKPLWSVQVTTSGYTGLSAPGVGDGMVVLQYDYYEQTIAAFGETTGSNLWAVTPGYYSSVSGVSGVPIVTRHGVYLGAEDGFYGLSPKDGSTVWSATLTANPPDSPVLSESGLFVTDANCCTQGDNTIFDPATGAVEGAFAGTSAPVMNGKTLIVSLDGVLYDYSPGSGNVHWSFAGDGTLNSSPVVINGYVAALSEQGNLYLLDGSTGAQLWTTTLGANYYCCGGPDTGLGAGEGVLLVPYGGTLYAFAPQEGARLGSRPEPTRVVGHLIKGHFVPN